MIYLNNPSNLKGKIFEWFVKTILKRCGFTDVVPDNFIVYNGTMGLMIHGIGQAQNADVLVHPPFQIPFYFPSRLLVECKAYGRNIGLPIIRGVLGLREDINNFEIITPKILKLRRNYRRRTSASYNYNRYSYQVALASLLGIKYPALEFAVTHKIPILTFYNSTKYSFLRDLINSIDNDFCDSLGDNFENVISFFKGNINFKNYRSLNKELELFVKKSNEFFNHMYIGVTESGIILFLYSEKAGFKPSEIELKCTIHWSSNQGEWWINLHENELEKNINSFYFELPTEIFNNWADSKFDRIKAISIKEKDFKRISVFSYIDNKLVFFILKLDMDFIKRAKRNLQYDL